MCPVPSAPSNTRKPDRRVEKTKQALFEALVELMIEKGYEAITIADVAERANVGRSTFYAHYADKDDLLQESLRGLRHHLTTAKPLRQKPDDPVHPALAFSLPMLLHVQEARELFCALVGKQQGAPVQAQLHVMLTDLVRETLETQAMPTAQPPVLAAEAVVGAFLAVATWWMNGQQQLSAEEVDSAFRSLFALGSTD